MSHAYYFVRPRTGCEFSVAWKLLPLRMVYVSAAYEGGAVRKMRGTPCQCVRCNAHEHHMFCPCALEDRWQTNVQDSR